MKKAILFPLVGTIFIWRLKILSNVIIKPDQNYISRYSVMISNVSVQYKEILLKEFKEMYGEENVINAYLVYDLESLINNINRMNELEKQLSKANETFESTGERPRFGTYFGLTKGSDTIDNLSNEIEKCKTKIESLKKISNLNITGYAFVTFSSIDAAKRCIIILKKKVSMINVVGSSSLLIIRLLKRQVS
jgi:hypothetical protein